MDQQSKQPNKQTEPKKKKPRRPKKHIWKAIWVVLQVLIVLGLMSGLFAGGVAAGFFASQVQDEPLRSYDEIFDHIYELNQTGEAYFRNDELIGTLRTAEISQPITLQEVSPHLIDAILATEDNYFYDHRGVNFKATTRAVIEMFTTAGQGTGGSTITQQLVKNQLLDSDREFERKFKEMLLAMRVERMFNKDQILEAYMNIMYMGFNSNGTNIYGVQAAAEGIFDLDVKDLNIAQSAYLAGMIHSPGRYTPFGRSGQVSETNLERGQQRMEFVLSRMLTTQRITQAQYDEAKRFNIRGSLAKPKPGIVQNYPFLSFEIERRVTDILIQQMLDRRGLDREGLSADALQEYRDLARIQLQRGGLNIYTTIDKELYEAFHEIAALEDSTLLGPRSTVNKQTVVDPETGEEKEIGFLEQTAATLIDNETGAILAMIEGRDFKELEYNLNTAPRQPGSSIKPLLDYAPAFELGLLQPASILDDSPIFRWDISTNSYWIPQNWYRHYKGLTTVRKAMEQSYNIPAIKTLLLVQEAHGRDVPFEYLKKMGITTLTQQDYNAPSTAIGGFTYGLTVEEMTAAYATFANGGIFQEAYLIERIENAAGDIIFQHEQKPERVFSEQTAFLITDMMRDVINLGTGGGIRRGMGSNIDIAGKTGTTNDDFDYWFVGYTPSLSLGLWTGYEKREKLTSGYTNRNLALWSTLMKKVIELRPEYIDPAARFEMPSDIVRGTVCTKSGKLPNELCREAGYLVEDYFNRQFLPTEVDDTLIEARVVTYNGETYLAHENTPDDLVDKGIYVRREPLEIPEQHEHERHRFIPQDWDQVAPHEVDPREQNGKAPDTPTNLRMELVESGIKITWSPVADEDVAGYRIYRYGSDRQATHIASVQSHLPKEYIDGNGSTAHAYQIVAVDIDGQESEPSGLVTIGDRSPSDFLDSGLPNAPSNVRANRGVLTVDLSWAANDEDEGVLYYTIYYTNDPVNGFSVLDYTSNTSFRHSFTEMPRDYYYYITATNELGESDQSRTLRVSFGQGNNNGGGNDNPPDDDEEDDDENIIDLLP